jgi:hypothetical protein
MPTFQSIQSGAWAASSNPAESLPSPHSSDAGNAWCAFATSAHQEVSGVADALTRDYRPQLATPALVAEVRRLLLSQRRAGRLVCRYLADLADRIQEGRERELAFYVDELHAAACFFDLGARDTRERVRIGRALRSLPQIEAAFITGHLSYSRVREVTRVARADTESDWLELGRTLDMRSLERRVAASSRSATEAPPGGEDGYPSDMRAHEGPESRCVQWDATTGFDATDGTDAAGTTAAAGADTADVAGAADMDSADQDIPSATTASANGLAPAAERTHGSESRPPASIHAEWIGGDAVRMTIALSAQTWALLASVAEGDDGCRSARGRSARRPRITKPNL